MVTIGREKFWQPPPRHYWVQIRATGLHSFFATFGHGVSEYSELGITARSRRRIIIKSLKRLRKLAQNDLEQRLANNNSVTLTVMES